VVHPGATPVLGLVQLYKCKQAPGSTTYVDSLMEMEEAQEEKEEERD
jgi:hypothetical protein